jgi:hypothetical protein
VGYFEASSDEAEISFYAAFENLDLDLMRATWLQSDDSYCIHPGGPVHKGFDTVLEHWSHILTGNQPPQITYKLISKMIQRDVAIHLVEEIISTTPGEDLKEGVTVIATNTYIKTPEGWRLFSHHASLPPTDNKLRHTQSIH